MTEELLFAAVRWTERVAARATNWYQRNLVPIVPPTNRLAYVFRPATADLITMCLILATLLPVWGGRMPWVPCLLLLVLAGHVGATWLAHTVNLVKLRTFEKLSSPLAAQQQLLKSKDASLQQLMQGNMQLQASIQMLEVEAAKLPAVKAQHDLLQAKAQEVQRLQQLAEVGRKTLLRLPKLYTQLHHLQARRRTMEKVKWAVQVLKAETARADKYSKEYAQLKAARTTSQASKASTAAVPLAAHKQAARPAAQGSPLKARDMNAMAPAASCTSPTAKGKAPTRTGETRRSADSLTLYTARQSMATTPCSGTSKAKSPTTKSTAAVPVKTVAGTLSGYRLKGAIPADSCTGSVGSVTTAAEPSFKAALPTHSNSTGSISHQHKPSIVASQPTTSHTSTMHGSHSAMPPASTSHDKASSPGQNTSVTAGPQLAPKVSPRASVGSVGVVGVSATTNTLKAAPSGKVAAPPLARLSTNTATSQDTPTSSGSHAQHRWTRVVDNEAFFTPIVASAGAAAMATPMSDASFTPGPEAAAFAAALSAGLVPVPSHTGSIAQSQHSGVLQPSADMNAARLSYGFELGKGASMQVDALMDDASYPPIQNQAPALSAPVAWQGAAQDSTAPHSMTISVGSLSLR